MSAAQILTWPCRVALVGALVVASAVIHPFPAEAAPGDALSRPVAVDLLVTPADTGISQIIGVELGATAAPPDASSSMATAAIQADLGPTLGGVSDVVLLESLQSTSTSNNSGGTAASASVGRMEMQTPGGPLVIHDVDAAVSCSRGSAPWAVSNGPSLVTLSGVEVPLDPSGTTLIDLSTGSDIFRITLTHGLTASGTGSASATGLVLSLEEDLPGIISASGTITLAEVTCEPFPMRTTTGVIRAAETGAPMGNACLVWSPATAPGQNAVLNVNFDGSFSFDTDEPGAINLGFFVPASPYDCGSAIAPTPLASWLDNQPLVGVSGAVVLAPLAAQEIVPGTQGIVACLGLDGPVAAADCVAPDVTLSGQVLGAGGAPEHACIFVLGDPTTPAFGPYQTAANGTWSASALPRDTPLAVGFIPYFVGDFGPCANNGPPAAPPDGALQPVFFGNVWVDFNDPDLFTDPRGWGSARGATLLTGSAGDVDACLTDTAGSQVPRPTCNIAAALLPATGADALPAVALGLAAMLFGLILSVRGALRRRG